MEALLFNENHWKESADRLAKTISFERESKDKEIVSLSNALHRAREETEINTRQLGRLAQRTTNLQLELERCCEEKRCLQTKIDDLQTILVSIHKVT